MLEGLSGETSDGFGPSQDHERRRVVRIQLMRPFRVEQSIVHTIGSGCQGEQHRLLHVAQAVVAIRGDRSVRGIDSLLPYTGCVYVTFELQALPLTKGESSKSEHGVGVDPESRRCVGD
jgi:hypothetical protein